MNNKGKAWVWILIIIILLIIIIGAIFIIMGNDGGISNVLSGVSEPGSPPPLPN